MEEKKIESLDSVKIHHEVISTIASQVVTNIAGVVNLSGSIVTNLAERLGKKTPDKGVRTEVLGEEVKVGISIVVNYGVKIPEICWQIQKNVRKAIEEMTGLHVISINVNVEGVEVKRKSEKVQDELEQVVKK